MTMMRGIKRVAQDMREAEQLRLAAEEIEEKGEVAESVPALSVTF